MWQVVAGLVIFGVAIYSIFHYPSLLYRSVRQMRRGWRVAALLPLLVVIPVVVVTIRGLQQGSNLWPIYLIVLAPVVLLYHIVLRFLHARTHNR
jgi:hypothetical protein